MSKTAGTTAWRIRITNHRGLGYLVRSSKGVVTYRGKDETALGLEYPRSEELR